MYFKLAYSLLIDYICSKLEKMTKFCESLLFVFTRICESLCVKTRNHLKEKESKHFDLVSMFALFCFSCFMPSPNELRYKPIYQTQNYFHGHQF